MFVPFLLSLSSGLNTSDTVVLYHTLFRAIAGTAAVDWLLQNFDVDIDIELIRGRKRSDTTPVTQTPKCQPCSNKEFRARLISEEDKYQLLV